MQIYFQTAPRKARIRACATYFRRAADEIIDLSRHPRHSSFVVEFAPLEFQHFLRCVT